MFFHNSLLVSSKSMILKLESLNKLKKTMSRILTQTDDNYASRYVWSMRVSWVNRLWGNKRR